MICTKCRFITDDDSVFCPRCGEKMESSAEGSEAVARLFKSFNNTVPVNGIKLGEDVSSSQSKTADNGSRSDHTSIAGLPPISTNAYVKDPNKIKHNSESEKRIASGNTLDIIKALTGKIIKSVKDDTDRISNVYKDAAEQKLSRSIRKSIRADHAHTQKEITAYKNALRQLEQRLAEFKGQNTLLSQNLDKLWNKLDELMASYDSKVNDLLEYSKRGSLGSSESAYGIKFVNEWKTDIDSIISQIRLSEIKMADMLLSCDYDTTLFLKSLKNTNTAELKKYQKSVIKSYKSSRFNAPSIICMVLVIAGLVLSYYFFKTIKRDTSIEVHIIGSILLGSWALGFYHIYHFKMFYGEINESLFLIKETWFFIIFPPIWAIICIRGLISVMCCTIFGFFTGPIYMVLDPLRFLLGKQCISQNQ